MGGMSFGVEANFSTGEYEIIPNEEYGAEIPSALLRPTVGDACFLSGFDPSALSRTAVREAEKELKRRAEDYLAEVPKGA